ncbi:MAG TPA: hypothetical protein VLK65_03390 [Vicinamibacteria bacterium]|nr:hypothetical protein [Vicinamibacteria bacterium]
MALAALTAYRDGIKSILDQTIQAMKQGERPTPTARAGSTETPQICFRFPGGLAQQNWSV